MDSQTHRGGQQWLGDRRTDKACCGHRERVFLASTEVPEALHSDWAPRDLQVLQTCPLGQPVSVEAAGPLAS